jgi:DNA replication protein DnaC
MEHIGDILKKQTPTNTSKANTGTSSSIKTGAVSQCPVCGGAGVVHPRLPSGEPDYSHTIPCSCQNSPGGEQQERLFRYSNLGSLTRLTFERLEPRGKSGNPRNQEQFRQALEAALAFTANPKGWLIYSGPSGSGKTHLTAAIVNERIRQGFPAFYVTAPDLLDHLRASFNPGSEIPYDEFFEQVRNAPLLVLDDLGAQTGTPWAREKMDQLLTARFNAELPTIIVTITPVSEIEDRLRTRLTDSRLCQIFILEEDANLPAYSWGPEFERQKTMIFSTFERRNNLAPEQQENLESATREALEFAKDPEGWLVFMGVTGCGKTHLAAAIVNYRYQAGQPALFVVVPEFLDHLRSAFSPESKISYDQLFESVKTAPLLVMDDFGEHSATSWVKEKLYQLINYRYNAQLPTVITTRYSLDEILDEVDSAISSRLVDRKFSTPIFIMAPDYRSDAPKKRNNRNKIGRYH